MSNRWKSIIAVVLSISFFNASLTSALAVTDIENPYAPSVIVSNDTTEVSVDDNGILKWRDKSSMDWQSSNLQYSKNGVSSLYVFDDVFVATSYFNIATSTDGKNWTTKYIQAGKKFDPENIITDDEFFKGNTMSIQDIQKFLESHSDCKNSYCLANYKQYTKSLSGGEYCSGYPASGYQSAAEIIYNASVRCKVSAEVILTTLQKEQALVTADAPSSGELRIAMGYACPDTADCDKKFFGFQQQVYNAAKQFQAYRIDPEFDWFPVGRSSYVEYHAAYSYNKRTKSYTTPTGCGGTNLTIRNEATAALYYYTPYQPNASALKNLFGTGDECGAYGNRNFWRIYNQWFNDTRDYKVFVVKHEDTFYAYDDTGSILKTKDLSSSWEYLGDMGLSKDLRVLDISERNGNLRAITNKEGHYLVSNNGTKWELRQEIAMVTEEKISLATHEPLYIRLATDKQTTIDGKVIISVDGSDYDEITINASNFALGIIRIPSFILNDGSHTIELKYTGSSTFLDKTITIKATVGSPQETIYHRVKMNDTIEEIAKKYETSIEWIREANDLSPNESISRGMNLKVKYIYNSNMLSTSPIYEQYHTVLPGQSLAVVALINNVTVERLKKLNNLTNDKIYVGQRIRFA